MCNAYAENGLFVLMYRVCVCSLCFVDTSMQIRKAVCILRKISKLKKQKAGKEEKRSLAEKSGKFPLFLNFSFYCKFMRRSDKCTSDVRLFNRLVNSCVRHFLQKLSYLKQLSLNIPSPGGLRK